MITTALALFSNKEIIDEIIVEPYETYVEKFNQAVQKLINIVPQVDSAEDVYSEEDKLKFILAFRAMIRLYKKMSHYTEFTWDDLDIEQQLFDGYTSKYLDLKETINGNPTIEKTSILNDIDFELELIRRDTINVTYILQLLIKAKQNSKNKNIGEEIFDLLNTEVSLRSKCELIENLYKGVLPNIEDTDEIPEEFEKFWNEEQEKALKVLIQDENLSREKTERLIENYLFEEREPLRIDILDLRVEGLPSILKSKEVGDRIFTKIINFVDTFVSGIAV